MNSPKYLRFEYVEIISKKFPGTFFHWWYIDKYNQLNPSSHKRFNELDKFLFFKKDRILRNSLCDETTDELRLDFDNKDINENLNETRKVIERLHELGLNKYEVYLTGSKGTHLQLRYDYSSFLEWGERDLVRKALFEVLNLDVKIDPLLFRTNQMIGLEGYNHRKTNKPKLRIELSKDSYEVLGEQLNFKYLNDEYVNKLSLEVINRIKDILNHKNSSKTNEFSISNIDFNKKTNYNKEILIKHLLRFKELHENNLICHSQNRFSDMITRYLWLTTKDEEETKKYMSWIFSNLKLNINVDDRFKCTTQNMRSPAIFIYKDILTKEEFYSNWNNKFVAQNEFLLNERTNQEVF